MENTEQIRLKKIIDCFCGLVRIDSPSGSEDAIRTHLCELLEPLIGKGETDAAGNLKFTLPGTRPGPVCLFSSHMDTVEPGRNIIPRLDDDGRIRSDGSTVLGADDKDGITALIFALRRLREENAPHGPLEILFTVEEEKSLAGSARLTPGWLKAQYGWVFDGPGAPGTIYRNGVGKIKFVITVTGKAAHAGIAPEKGINALMLAAEGLRRFPPGRRENATINYGTVTGGQTDNIVPEKVLLTGEIRSRNSDRLEELRTELEQAWKEYGSICYGRGYPAYEQTDEIFLRRTQSIFTSAGMPSEIKDFSAGCDANYLARLGIKVCLLAMGRSDNHTRAESTRPEFMLSMSDIAFRLMTTEWQW